VLAKKQPGDKVKLGLLRDRKSLEVQVVLARRETLFEER
jgi:S1-C subfamily serine protease